MLTTKRAKFPKTLVKGLRVLEVNHFTVPLLLWLLISGSLLLLIVKGNLETETFKDNLRYFLSATAQAFAALVAIVWVIYSLSSSKIPNYEIIFGRSYPLILKEYNEIKKIKRVIWTAGFVIAILLMSLLFIIDNIKILFVLALINSLFFIPALIELILFFSRSMTTSNKDKFFRNCETILESKVEDFRLTEVFENIKNFEENVGSDDYASIRADKERIIELFNSVFIGHANLLKKREMIGSNSYYQGFRHMLAYFLRKDNIHKIHSGIYYRIKPYFKKHIEFCIDDGHCIKYIPDVIRLITQMIDGFSANSFWPPYESYLELFVEINQEVKAIKDSRVPYLAHYGLEEIGNTIARRGLWDYDRFIKLLDKIGIDRKTAISLLEEAKRDCEMIYGKGKSEKQVQSMVEYLGIIYYDPRDLSLIRENIERISAEILALKKKKKKDQ